MNLLIIPLFLLFVFSFSAVLTLCSGYGSYRKVYKTLKNRKFYRNDTQIYSHEWRQKDDGFVWFLDDNHFKLDKSVYIHASFVTYLDPYSFYWLIKYRKWFAENINIDTVSPY